MSLPKPYYDSDGIQIFHGDCREILPELPKFDLLLTDPPYGINYAKGTGGGAGASSTNRRNCEAIIGDSEPFDPTPWLDFPNVILWGANHFARSLPHGRWIAWNKLGDKEPWDTFSDVEFAWQNGRGKDRIFTFLWKGLCQSGAAVRRRHPTQKPVPLMRWCLGLVPDAQTILDPFLGSGTTLVAAQLEGRRGVGIEVNEKYCEIAANRLAQKVLF